MSLFYADNGKPRTPPVSRRKIILIIGWTVVIVLLAATAFRWLGIPGGGPAPSAAHSRTPTASPSASSGYVTITPPAFDCAKTMPLMITIVFPASLKANDSVTSYLDGHQVSIGKQPITPTTMSHAPDGTWRSRIELTIIEVRSACASGSGLLSDGTHILRFDNSAGLTLAVGSYTVRNSGHASPAPSTSGHASPAPSTSGHASPAPSTSGHASPAPSTSGHASPAS